MNQAIDQLNQEAASRTKELNTMRQTLADHIICQQQQTICFQPAFYLEPEQRQRRCKYAFDYLTALGQSFYNPSLIYLSQRKITQAILLYSWNHFTAINLIFIF